MTDVVGKRSAPRQVDVDIDYRPAGPTAGRGIELPQLLIALLLVALFALAAVWWLARSTNREPYLALANDLAAGQVLSAEDLTTILVNVDRPESVALVKETSTGTYVGAVATADLSAGTMLAPSLFSTVKAVEPGNGLVGTLAKPDEQPTTLDVGDSIIAVLHDGQTPPSVVAEFEATIYSLRGAEGSETGIVLEMSEADAQQTAVFAALNLIAIVEVDR